MASSALPTARAIPQPDPNDSTEVMRGLLAARELWEQGQLREAVRAIQRAAEAAEQDGNDVRALALIRAAADLRSELPPEAEGEAETADNEESRLSDGGISVSIATDEEPAPSAPPASARLSNGAVNGHAAHDVPLDDVAPAPVAAPATASVAPAPPVPPAAAAAASPSAAPAPSRSVAAPPPPGPPVISGQRISSAPLKSSIAPRATHSANVAATSIAPAAPSVKPTAGTLSTPLSELIQSGLAERVSVKRSAVDPSLLVVRPGACKPARGARQAVLIYLDPEAD